jgi:succinate dehydrogenase / fumarate reductase, cytochrome b subunit
MIVTAKTSRESSMASNGKLRVRPVSPYTPYVLSVLRLRSLHTMGLSILHRITGVVLSLGFALLVYWLLAVSLGSQAYAQARALFATAGMQVLLVGGVFSFCYHFLNGIRHLVWDAGRGFDPGVARRSGYAVLAAALSATAVICYVFRST